MDFNELISKRYSVRSYKPQQVDQELLDQVLTAGQLAPTAANRQPFRIIVLRTKGNEKKLRKIYNREWFTQPPIIFCVCAIEKDGWKRYDGKNFTLIDAAIVMDHMIMAAADIGLGTCWVGAFNPDYAKELLQLPTGVEPIVFSPLGYPNDEQKPRERKSLDKLVCYDHWRK